MDKVQGYVYAGGSRLAKQVVIPPSNSAAVSWYHQNPGSTSWVESAADHSFGRREMDPLGAETGTYDPYFVTYDPVYDDVHSNGRLYMEGGDPFDLSGGCTLDGMPISCNQVNQMLRGRLGGRLR